MKILPTEIPGLILLEPKSFGDARGFFFESYQRDRYRDAGIPETFVQDNVSRSSRGTLRGLHYQLVQPQGKLVFVTRGEVFDVAVDMRRSSPTFGRWFGVFLNDENHRQLYVPPGFAHGFVVTSDGVGVTNYRVVVNGVSVMWWCSISKTMTNIEEMAVVISKSKSELYAPPNSFNITF